MIDRKHGTAYWLRALQNLIGLFILGWFVWYLWQQRQLLAAIDSVAIGDGVRLAGLIIVGWLVTSAQSYVLFRRAGASIGFWESYVLTLASSFGNYLPLRAGTMVRAYYMKSRHQLEYMHFGSVFGLRLVLLLIASGLVGGAAILLLPGQVGEAAPLLALFCVMVLGPSLLYLWQPAVVQTNGRIYRLWQQFAAGINQLKSKPSISFICLVLVVCQLLLLAWRFQFAASILGHSVGLSVVLIWVALASVASFVAITPGGLGVRESLMGYATLVTGGGFSLGLLVGSVDRVLLLLLTALLGGVSFVWLWWQLNRAEAAASRF